jgi:hypothetical protein
VAKRMFASIYEFQSSPRTALSSCSSHLQLLSRACELQTARLAISCAIHYMSDIRAAPIKWRVVYMYLTDGAGIS